MALIVNSVQLQRSPEDVFDYLIDMRNELKWNPAVESLEKISDGPIGLGTKFRAKWKQTELVEVECMEQVSPGPLPVGSQLRQVNMTGQVSKETLVQVTHLVPDQTIGIERLNLRGTFTLGPIEAGTQLNALFEVEATGFSALMYRMFLRQFVTSDLRKFKALVEAG